MTATEMWLSLKEEPILRMSAQRIVSASERIQDCLQRISDSLEHESRGREFALPYVESQVEHAKKAVRDLGVEFSFFVEHLLAHLPGV